jgi:hypothetical protein
MVFPKDFRKIGSMVKAYFQFSKPTNLPALSNPVSVKIRIKDLIIG